MCGIKELANSPITGHNRDDSAAALAFGVRSPDLICSPLRPVLSNPMFELTSTTVVRQAAVRSASAGRAPLVSAAQLGLQALPFPRKQ